MSIDPNTLTVILGLITNGLTSLISISSKEIGKFVIGKEFLEKWELEKTALLPILQTAISELAEHIELKETRGEEVISLFLLSPEVEDIVRQIYSLQLVRNDIKQEDFQSIRTIFLTLFTRFIASYPSEVTPRQEQVADISSLLLNTLLKGCNLALNAATNKGILAAHEAQSNLRHNIIHSEIGGIQKKLDFLISQHHLDIHAIFEFEKKYLQQMVERHGYITPPNFDTARQLPVDDLYVCPSFAAIPQMKDEQETLQLDAFLTHIFRAVLLGNPGGGKSTLSVKLCHDLAVNQPQRLIAGRRELTPILVVLRNYGVEKKERRCSILEFIETEVEATYQLPSPPKGAFEYLLLNGRAVVIFDGLDELLDTSYRQEIRDDVQSFCNLYPSVPILVTSRVVGYEQAPLAEHLFEVFHLQPFTDPQVEEYVQRWFTLSDIHTTPKMRQQKIDLFLKESEGVSDIRSNALMLALMCNIYRGENYIPKNRPDVYEKCATMLFERWDRSRNIRIALPFEVHIRPAMMYIAYWIYTNAELRAGVTERMLIAKASEYLLQKRFEDPDEAERAAQEFIRFCRGRAWIFTDMGTEKSGERLYQFTHQTFLEYFTAAYLVRTHPSSEALMTILLPRIAKREWDVVAQLAFQIQNKNSEDAGDKLLSVLTEYANKNEDENRSNALSFAARSLNFIVPSPKITREITRACIKFLVAVGTILMKKNEDKHNLSPYVSTLLMPLLFATIENCAIIADDLEKTLTNLVLNGDKFEGIAALELSENLRHLREERVYSWRSVYNQIYLKSSDKLEVLLQYSLFLCYNAVWERHTSINNMVRWFGLIGLFGNADEITSIYGNITFGSTIGDMIINEVLYSPKDSRKYFQLSFDLLEELGQELHFYIPSKINRLFTIKKSYLQSLVELRPLKKNEKMPNLGRNSIFALFVLFAMLLELCDLFNTEFGFESIKLYKHPFYSLIHWIFLARFEQVKMEIVQDEIVKRDFSGEQQSYIWQWIRKEINFVEQGEIQLFADTLKASQQKPSRKKGNQS